MFKPLQARSEQAEAPTRRWGLRTCDGDAGNVWEGLHPKRVIPGGAQGREGEAAVRVMQGDC
jgi:hypothetical protein